MPDEGAIGNDFCIRQIKMATLKIDKVAAYIHPEEFDPVKWRHPLAYEHIEISQMVSVDIETEKVSLFRAERLKPPDGVAVTKATIGDPVVVLAYNMPDAQLILVFRVPDAQLN